MNTIRHNQPCLGKEEIEAVTRVIRSGWLAMDQEVIALEKDFRKITGKKYTVAVNSGLSALHLSLIALGVGRGHGVILPSYTCAALLHAINYVGATPILVDSEKYGFNLDTKEVKKKLTTKTRAIIAPHTFGFPANMNALIKLGIPVIEDCAQGLGTLIDAKPTGSIGEVSIFSFYASKMIAGGQGGLIATDNPHIHEVIHSLIRHDQQQQYIIRYNYQYTDLAASIVRVQLNKLPKFIKRRTLIALKYGKALRNKKNIIVHSSYEHDCANNYRFIIECISEKKRGSIQKILTKKGITTIVPIASYQLLHRQLNLNKRDFPRAEKLGNVCLSLPIYPCLTDKEVERITEALSGL